MTRGKLAAHAATSGECELPKFAFAYVISWVKMVLYQNSRLCVTQFIITSWLKCYVNNTGKGLQYRVYSGHPIIYEFDTVSFTLGPSHFETLNPVLLHKHLFWSKPGV